MTEDEKPISMIFASTVVILTSVASDTAFFPITLNLVSRPATFDMSLSRSTTYRPRVFKYEIASNKLLQKQQQQ